MLATEEQGKEVLIKSNHCRFSLKTTLPLNIKAHSVFLLFQKFSIELSFPQKTFPLNGL